MITSPLKHSNYRPSFSGHETFTLRYGWLQKTYESVNAAGSESEALHLFRDPASIARFGVGRNMVSAMRYWATQSEIIADVADGVACGWLGELLFGKAGVDQYLEEAGSLWLAHWNLASHAKLTSFYWLFNEYTGGAFSRKDIVQALMSIAREMEWPRTAETTVDRDVQCLLRTYIGGRGGSEAGDSILAELGLVRPLGGGRFSLSRGHQSSLPDAVFFFAVWDFWDRTASQNSTLSYEALAFGGSSPGRVFLLDDAALSDRLEALEVASDGAFIWSETAGLKQLVRQKELSFDEMVLHLRDRLSVNDWSAAA